MIKFLKENRTFTLCLILTFISIIIGLLFNAVIDDTAKGEITTNISQMVDNISNKMDLNGIFKVLFNNTSLIFIIWLVGMSVIGIPVILFIYLFRVFIVSFEFVSLILNLKMSKILFILIYMIPGILNLIIYFILIYYGINYSLVLIRLLFFKKNYNIKAITNRYFKILLFVLLCTLVTSLLESIVIPKILIFFK